MILQYAFYFRRTARMITPRIVHTCYRHFRKCQLQRKSKLKEKKCSPYPLDWSLQEEHFWEARAPPQYNFSLNPSFSLTIQHVFINPPGLSASLHPLLFKFILFYFSSNPCGLKNGYSPGNYQFLL